MKKKFISFILSLIILLSTANVVVAKTFVDTKDHWAKEYIDTLSDYGFISGYEGNVFKPNSQITKAEFFTVVNNMANLKKTYTVTFSDVSPKDWYYNEVAKAIKSGYLVPTTGNLYPDRPITREEAFYIFGYLYNFQEETSDLKNFSDSDDIKPEYRGYMAALVKNGVVSGDNGKLNPKSPITRAEFCAIAANLIDKYGLPEEKVVIDSKIKFGSRNLYNW